MLPSLHRSISHVKRPATDLRDRVTLPQSTRSVVIRPNRKSVVMILVSLAIGAMVTILVAWSLALNGDSLHAPHVEGAPWPGKPGLDWPPNARFATQYSALWCGGGLRQWTAWGNHNGSHSGDYQMFVTRAGWPFPALESCLRHGPGQGFWFAERGPYDNDSTIESGLTVPLHWCRPQESGEAGWCSRRLPLKPIGLGFIANTLLTAPVIFTLLILCRLQPTTTPIGSAFRRSRWKHPVTLVILALFANILVAFGLWARWQYATSQPSSLWLPRGGVSAAQGATTLSPPFDRWPAEVPSNWSPPRWIGWLGEAPGVRTLEMKAKGIPAAAFMWLHVHWSSGAFNDDQSMNITQIGWPLPCLQAEETIEKSPVVGGVDTTVRRATVCDVTLPFAPSPTHSSDPAPFLPVRPLALGMVANTLMFTCVLSAVILTPAALRTLLRRCRHQCEHCGYPRAGLPDAICPECGRSP